MPTEDMDAFPHVVAHRYRVGHELGRGGWGVVYAAEDLTSGAQVAIKVLHAEMVGTTGRKRFLQEIDFARRLAHPGIVPVLDSGEAAGSLYFVMPVVEGESLHARLLRERQLPVPEALRIAREVADALTYAHAAGIVHRDIKPANILLSADRAVVADFGIARALTHRASVDSISSSGVQVGTAAYMSPEQAAGDRELDGRSDLYSLGCVLYEMLGGGPPFTGPTAQSLVARHAIDPVPPLRTVRPSVPASLEDVVYRALAKSPADRFRDTQEFAVALEKVAADPLVSVVGTGRRGRRRVMMGAAAVAVVIAGLWATREMASATEAHRLAAADTGRLMIFPVEGAPTASAAANLDDGLRRAFLRWKGVTAVDPAVVRELLGPGEAPSASRAQDMALAQKARRYVRTIVTTADGELRVRIAIVDATAPATALAEADGRLAQSGAARDSMLQAIADRVLIRNDVPASFRAAVAGTTSLPARQAYVGGLIAFDAWDLARADSQFSLALKFDPEFAHASLGIGLARHWTNQKPPLWSGAANAANNGRARLTNRERAQTDALRDVVAGRMPEACARWGALARADTLDFAAWYGAAYCLAYDNTVVPDPRSVSGWRFRTSYRAALARYRRAFELHPAVLRALRRDAFDPVRRLLKTSISDMRRGKSAPPLARVFASYASLDSDTLAFVPFPSEIFTGSDPQALARIPRTTGDAIRRQRALFRDIASAWRAAEPSSAEAHEAVAWSMLLLGDDGALDALAGARRLTRRFPEALRLAATEAWMRAQFAIPDDLPSVRRVRMLADSVLADPLAPGLGAPTISSLAALLGRAHDAARWERGAASTANTGVADALAGSARALLIYSALGGPVDSLRAMERAIDSLLVATVPPATVADARVAALGRAASLGFGVRPFDAAAQFEGSGDYLLAAQAAWLRRDTAAVRAAFARLAASRSAFSAADLTLDALLPEASLLFETGDATAAIRWLDPTLNTLRVRAIANDPVHAASLVRAMQLRARLAGATGDTATARRWSAPVAILWAGADAFLQSAASAGRRP